MNREITFAQLLAVSCFAALTFVAGYEFHNYTDGPQSIAQGSPQKSSDVSKPNSAARPVISNPDSPYDQSGPRGTADAADISIKPMKPKSFSKTIALMPGQSFNAPRGQFRKLEVRSEYPLDVASGPCHESYTVEFLCDSDPADFFVRDTRRVPVFSTPKANEVTITVTEF